jgi:hypothetical protein
MVGDCTRKSSLKLNSSVAMMKRNLFCALSLSVIVLSWLSANVQAKETAIASKAATAPAASVDFFDAVDSGQINAKFIAMNDHAARIFITNKTNQPLNLNLPAAFAGVPIAAQFGGAGGGARGGARAGGGGRTGGGGGQQQSVGGGGGGGGIGGGGGGGGFFSVPPEKTEKIDVPVLCLNHGLRDPSSATAYKIVPADSVVDRPAVVELLKAFGRGELKHSAAQAAAWHLNNDMSWKELAAKLQGTRRSFRRPPYFTADDIRTGMTYANAAMQLADANADKHRHEKKEKIEKPIRSESSDLRSTTDAGAKEPAKTDAAASSTEKK